MDTDNFDIPAELIAQHEANVKAFTAATEAVFETATLLGAYWAHKMMVEHAKLVGDAALVPPEMERGH